MTFKSGITKGIEADIRKKEQKAKKPKENTMKNKSLIEAIKTWTIVVLIGLITVAATYLYAFNQGAAAERSKAEEIKQAAKAMTAKVETASLKQ